MEKANTTYIKSTVQISLENIIHVLIEGYRINSVSQLDEKICSLSIAGSDEANALASKYEIFKNLLAKMIYELADEFRISESIENMGRDYGGVKTLQGLLDEYNPNYKHRNEYDTYFEMVNTCYDKLFSEITKGPDKGKLHIDTFFNKPDAFVFYLRCFLCNNTLKDSIRSINRYTKTIDYNTDYYSDKIEEKYESLKGNDQLKDNTFDDKLIKRLSYSPERTNNFIHAILNRFIISRPVACYIYFLMLLGEYDPVEVVNSLVEEKFESLFGQTLCSVEKEFDINLDYYKNIDVNANEYIDSLKNAKAIWANNGTTLKKSAEKVKRDRIDRLASESRRIVHGLQEYKSIEKCIAMNSHGTYWCLR